MSTSTSKSNHIVLLNFHGGFPSCFMAAALEHLECFRTLSAQGCDVYDRVYTSNVCAAGALHDLLMDSPVHSMVDACWHPWSKTSMAVRSIFTLFREHGYRTHLLGAYGLDERFDQHRNTRDYPYHLETALQCLGVDQFDTDDGAFTCRAASAHDRAALERLAARIGSWAPHEKHFAVINLLGCQDVHRCSWSEAVHQARIPTLSPHQWMPKAVPEDDLEAALPSSVLSDDPRRQTLDPPVAHGAKMRQGLRRLCMLHDHLKGQDHEAPSREALTRAVNALQRHAWTCLVQLDTHVKDIVQRVIATGGSLLLMTDHPMSLYEHGVVCEAPWDACTRGFVVSSTPTTRASSSSPRRTNDVNGPSLVHRLLFEAGGLQASSWHALPCTPHSAVTISAAPSHLCRSSVTPCTDSFQMPFLWVRAVISLCDRTYAVVYWWSLDDLIETTFDSSVCHETHEEKSAIVRQQETWCLPLHHAPEAVFDLTEDPSERTNLMEAHDAWDVSGEYLEVRLHTTRILTEHQLSTLRLRFPTHVHSITPDTVALCSVQFRPETRVVPPPVAATPRVEQRSVSVQTEPTVHFSRPVRVTAEEGLVVIESPPRSLSSRFRRSRSLSFPHRPSRSPLPQRASPTQTITTTQQHQALVSAVPPAASTTPLEVDPPLYSSDTDFTPPSDGIELPSRPRAISVRGAAVRRESTLHVRHR